MSGTCSLLSMVFGGCRFLPIKDPPSKHHQLTNPNSNNVSVQVLRSAGELSADQLPEDSIHKAYISAINNSRHFIYIENQFFISSKPREKPPKILNEIQRAICDRIVRAYKEAEDFHVFIVLPLQPELPGRWGTGGDKDRVSYWNYATLYSGEDSLMHKLQQRLPKDVNLYRYFSVYGLRTHGVLSDEVVTEIIYVHSKLMIVDDRLAIIGSANINDRSMLGDGDSEVSVVIEDREMVDGRMNGEVYPVGKFCHELRIQLFKVHLGLLKEKKELPLALRDPPDLESFTAIIDPLVYKFYTKVSEIAYSNTNTYEYVFGSRILPTDSVANEAELAQWLQDKSPIEGDVEKAQEILKEIQGNVVLFPSLFLKDDLKPCPAENFLPFAQCQVIFYQRYGNRMHEFI